MQPRNHQSRERVGRRRWAAVLAILFAGLALAEPAYAWGPATHVSIASDVLRQLALLPGALAAILGRCALQYVFGTIAADVVFAKRLSRVRQFCHHWSTGFRLLDDADSDAQRAFAYGYLSHLAADTVAHGKYVPRQIALTDSTINFGHFYWELRADAMADVESHRTLHAVLAHDHDPHHDLMARHLTQTFLPYELNRVVFDRINAMAAGAGSRRTMEIISRCSRYALDRSLLDAYRSECVDRSIAVLRDGPSSALMQEDPNGTGALIRSRLHRRAMRRKRLLGRPVDNYVSEMTRSLEPALTMPAIPAEADAPLSTASACPAC